MDKFNNLLNVTMEDQRSRC